MANEELLREKIAESGLKMSAIADKMGVSRQTLYKKIRGDSDFLAGEVVVLTRVLQLSRGERDKIFLDKKLYKTQH